MERLAELDLHIVHKPGKANVSADVLSRYGKHVKGESIDSAKHSMANPEVARAVRDWL